MHLVACCGRGDLHAEHTRLLEQTEQLQREHRELARSPWDAQAHTDHIGRLHANVTALRAHIARLRGEDA